MSEEGLQGYGGLPRDLLIAANVNVGDRISVEAEGNTYEGTLMPRTELGDPNHIVVKLPSGYNIGIAVGRSTRIKFLNPAGKPSFITPEPPPSKPSLPSVSVISTGGTIASRVDYRTGAVHPALSAGDLYAVVPELSNVAQVKTEILFSLLSENIAPSHWSTMAETIATHINNGAHGVVVTHGTDTMG
ncbi:MAG: asparaginase domain-containing protein, partial [Candidatus Bathyarchaeia archaeon]